MNKKFNKRAFISLITFFLSIMALITGIVLLVMPDATMAYWNSWSLLGLQKNQWEHFHAVISIYLTVIVIFHIVQNWKAMLSYMKSKAGEKFKNKKELLFASIVSIVLIAGSSVETPISSITVVFEPAQESWYDTKDEPPFEDAQGLPLEMLANIQSFDKSKIETIFRINKIKFDSLKETLEDIAEQNDTSSKRLYMMIKSNN